MNPDGPADRTLTGQESPWRVLGCWLLMMAALQVAVGHRVRLGEWTVRSDFNSNFAEAVALLDGRWEIPQRLFDTALFDGRAYSVNPPLFTFICYVCGALQRWQGEGLTELYRPWFVMLVALPLPIIGFAAFRGVTGRAAHAAFMTFVWIAGTPVVQCAATARGGGINSINQLLSQTGLMLMFWAALSPRRLGWAAVGLAIAGLSRPTTLFLAAPLFLAAGWRQSQAGRVGTRRIVVGATAALVMATLMGVSAAKFGSPFESGYKYVYEGRNDEMAQRGRAGIFAASHIPRNAWYMNVAFPAWQLDEHGLRPEPDSHGASIWLTMPILAYVLIDARRWWSDRRERVWMLSTFAVIAVLLCYHNTGYVQPGYYRYALDFLPVWLTLLAPRAWGGWRTAFTLGAAAWSCVYFSMMP